MDEIRVVIVNSWWRDPLFVATCSSILTGLIFALVLHAFRRLMEKRDVLESVISELTGNYRYLKELQGLSNVEGLDEGTISAIRKGMPWANELSDEQIILSYMKNIPVDDQLSIVCWNNLQPQVAKYSKEYPKYEKIYGTLKRIIKFSKIKSGTINGNLAEKSAVNQLSAIETNSLEYIRYYEDIIGERLL